MDRTVTVMGQGSATAVPDTALVRVAAVHRAASVADAFAGVASAVAAIGTEARRFTDERSIASRGLHVWPAHDNQGRQSGFEARHSVEIGCPDLTAASALLEALVAAVGNRLHVESVNLQVSEPGPLVTEAREAAYADAVVRATHLAGLAGASLGPIVSVIEGGGFQPFGEAVGVASMKADASFEPGETAISATVTASWQLQL
jgi:uncharacterized protein YggE